MTHTEQLKIGLRVSVPRHFKPRGTKRIYDAGTIIELDKGIAKVKLDDGREVVTAVGLVSPC